MPTNKQKVNFFDTDEGINLKLALEQMEADAAYNTQSSYSANAILYPNHRMPFLDKHMEYVRTHPAVDPQHYISNLRLITRIKVPRI